jgi:hypothetical protein
MSPHRHQIAAAQSGEPARRGRGPAAATGPCQHPDRRRRTVAMAGDGPRPVTAPHPGTRRSVRCRTDGDYRHSAVPPGHTVIIPPLSRALKPSIHFSSRQADRGNEPLPVAYSCVRDRRTRCKRRRALISTTSSRELEVSRRIISTCRGPGGVAAGEPDPSRATPVRTAQYPASGEASALRR